MNKAEHVNEILGHVLCVVNQIHRYISANPAILAGVLACALLSEFFGQIVQVWNFPWMKFF